jgi:hypothetical protein
MGEDDSRGCGKVRHRLISKVVDWVFSFDCAACKFGAPAEAGDEQGYEPRRLTRGASTPAEAGARANRERNSSLLLRRKQTPEERKVVQINFAAAC